MVRHERSIPDVSASKRDVPQSPKRRVQQRSIDSRLAILKAALSEFADNGFDAASIRRIAKRTKLKHPLITYYFPTKQILWRAVAEHVFNQIKTVWDERAQADSGMKPIDRIREEYFTFLRFTMEYPDFHHFMLRESKAGNPRLTWLIETFLAPLSKRVLRQIRASQRDGQLPKARPILIHYMFIGIATVLSSLGAEIDKISGISPNDPEVVDEYCDLIDLFFFKQVGQNQK